MWRWFYRHFLCPHDRTESTFEPEGKGWPQRFKLRCLRCGITVETVSRQDGNKRISETL